MFNLDSLATADSTTLHIKHPVSDELLYVDMDEKKGPVSIAIFGSGSKNYRQAISSMQNRSLKRGSKKATAEILREEGIELLVACSDKAFNFEYQGKPLNDASAFRALYSDPAFSWLKDQVDAGLGDVANFLQA